MALLAAVAAIAFSASPTDTVLVTSYQSLGVDAATAAKLGDGFRLGANKGSLTALGADESDKTGRSAVMCGEDAACLSTLGQRSGAKYVLAYGIGKVGSSLLVSAIFIDVATGKEITRASKRELDPMPDWGLVTRELSDLVVKPPAEPLVVQVPVPVEVPAAPHKLRTPAFVLLGVGLAFGIVSTVLGLVAAGNYSQLQMSEPGDARMTLYKNQGSLNFSADACLTLGVLTGLTGLVLLFIDSRLTPANPTFDTPPVVPEGAR